ncbi:MAG: RIP metalloprotease RseP, partial [Gammaproteobacteria bacterium]|nr:RIP metalloprotease RseP [Gammaproteobacteria bacterium]
MDSVFVSILSFIVALGVLIAVHEFGHFWVARKAGVKVIRFSIGFGRPLYQKIIGEDKTEFVIAAIPMGGYVKMVDEREGPVPEHDLHRAFNRQSLPKRFAVVAAGPVFNFIFAIFAYWCLFVVGVPGLKPIVDSIQENSPVAIAGMQNGDEIISINDRDTPTLEAVRMSLIENVIDQEVVDVVVKRAGDSTESLKLDLSQTPLDAISGDLFQFLGFTPYRPKLPPVIGHVVPGGAGEEAGFQERDEILNVDGQPYDDWVKWAEYVRSKPGVPISIVVLRDGMEIELNAVPAKIETQSGVIGRVGLGPYVPDDFYNDLKAIQHYGVFDGLLKGLQKTWDMSVMTLQMMWKMVVGEASLENISGPISIAKYAGQTAQVGILAFISFMAIISVSLGVLNLLPIPLLDGGHLMYYIIEFIKGSPVS